MDFSNRLLERRQICLTNMKRVIFSSTNYSADRISDKLRHRFSKLPWEVRVTARARRRLVKKIGGAVSLSRRTFRLITKVQA